MKVAVIGGGTMGNGIAHVFAQHEHEVVLIDTSEAALTRARAGIEQNLGRQVKKELLTEDQAQATLQRLQLSTDLAAAAPCALAVEAVFEDFSIKRDISATSRRSSPATPAASA